MAPTSVVQEKQMKENPAWSNSISHVS